MKRALWVFGVCFSTLFQVLQLGFLYNSCCSPANGYAQIKTHNAYACVGKDTTHIKCILRTRVSWFVLSVQSISSATCTHDSYDFKLSRLRQVENIVVACTATSLIPRSTKIQRGGKPGVEGLPKICQLPGPQSCAKLSTAIPPNMAALMTCTSWEANQEGPSTRYLQSICEPSLQNHRKLKIILQWEIFQESFEYCILYWLN